MYIGIQPLNICELNGEKWRNILPQVEPDLDVGETGQEILALDADALAGVEQPGVGNGVQLQNEDQGQRVHHEVLDTHVPVHEDDDDQDFGGDLAQADDRERHAQEPHAAVEDAVGQRRVELALDDEEARRGLHAEQAFVRLVEDRQEH